MMIVVAIVGVLSALGVMSIVSMTRLGRINGASGALARALVDGRLRAMTQRCPHVVQINGASFVPSAPPANDAQAPRTRGSVSVIRKAHCDAVGANRFFEAGASPDGSDRDRVLTTTLLGDGDLDTRGIRTWITAPTGLITGNELTVQSLAVAYDALGARTVSLHTGAGNSFSTSTTADISVVFTSPVDDTTSGTTARVNIPSAGVATRL
jgi:Tfp pilus assembly protein PilE